MINVKIIIFLALNIFIFFTCHSTVYLLFFLPLYFKYSKHYSS